MSALSQNKLKFSLHGHILAREAKRVAHPWSRRNIAVSRQNSNLFSFHVILVIFNIFGFIGNKIT